MYLFPIHIGMILAILGLSPQGFVFGLFLQKASYQLDVIHVYILIRHPIPNRCGTFVRLWVHTQHLHMMHRGASKYILSY